MYARTFPVWLCCCVLALAVGPVAGAEEPPKVPVCQPVVREVTDYEDFTGRTDAAASVALRARATGYIVKTAFKEGADVKKGDVLFEIDARPYQAELAKAEADVGVSEARLKLAQADYIRAEELFKLGAATKKDLEKAAMGRDEAIARVAAAKAVRDIAKVNVDYTTVTAPIDGKVGRRTIDVGNLVKADDTVLATIVTLKPMYVYFDLDEKTLHRIRRAVKDGKLKAKEDMQLSVKVGFGDEKGFPHQGTVKFADHQVNANTGTISVRAVLANADGLLSPGMFCRVRLTTSEPYKALLLPKDVARATILDGSGTFVWVVNEKNVIESRRVAFGPMQDDGLVVVRDGLKEGEWIVSGVAQNLKPGTKVQPQKEKP